MITLEQWTAYNEYLSERIAREPRFSISEHQLREKFGITRPFWEQMSKFALSIDRNYEAAPHHFSPTRIGDKEYQEPTEILYYKRRDDA